MLTLEELKVLMAGTESNLVEKTESTDKNDKFAQAICAFANDFPNHRRPGYLLIGVRDDGCPSGLQVNEKLLQNLAGLRSDGNILPPPALTIETYFLPEGDVVVVEVFPSDLPPVRYKGVVWIRIGPRRGIASVTEERILSERRTKASSFFDARPCVGSTLKYLSLDLFRLSYIPHAVASEVIEENQRTFEEQLASLRLYDLEKNCPTYAGLLLLGKNPRQWIPGAYIQFLRLAGTQLTDEVEIQQELSGDLLTILRELDSLVKLHNQSHLVQKTLLQEHTITSYPPIALRELLMNAVMHRSYEESTAPIRFYWLSDRIEIQNPGGLYGEVTPENFPKQNAYRNPLLAEAMKVLGYINKFGRGILRAQEALKQQGHPPAQFDFQPHYFLVTIK